MAQSSYQGRFIWQELLCGDPGSATTFYTRILPWKAQPFSPGAPYTMFTTQAGKPVAGAMRLSDEARAMGTKAHWRGYIGATDVDAVAAQAAGLGARIQQPAHDVPGVGRAALLTDPEGAVFGLYRPLSESGSNAPGESGFAWNELAARNRETALAFYQRLFGWELRPPMDMGGGFYYQTFGVGSQDFGGAYTIPADRAMPPSWCPYAASSSADETAGKVLAAGGKLAHGPINVPGGGRIVQFFDPQQAMFAVHSMAAPAVKPPAAAASKAPPKAAVRTVKPAAKKAPKKTAKKAPKKAAKKAPKKAKKKAKRKVTRKPARKVGRKSAGKRTRKAKRKPARKK